MSERAALTKTSENKGKNPLGAKPKENFYESLDSPVEQIFHLQRSIGNQAVQRLIKSGTIQAKLKIGQPNDKYEQEADLVADKVIRIPEPKGSLVNGQWSLGKQVTPLIQKQEEPEEEEERNREKEQQIQTKTIGDQVMRMPKSSCPECNEEEKEKIQTKPITENITPIIQRQVDSSEATESKAASNSDKTAAKGLIVEDSTTELAPGQMKKSQFLAQLQAAVYSTVESALEGTENTAEACPYIKYWFSFYRSKNSQYIERAVHKYAPETSRAANARDYISIITVRVSSAAVIWAKTGKITGVPKGIPIGMGGTGLIGGLVSKIGSIFFKARAGGPRNAENLHTIQARLGSGRPLDSGVCSRMGSAFGQDFSYVRIHNDENAVQLSNSLNARAFTIGRDIAFAKGEYRPGTLIGDALIAHELAHVIQQSGANSPAPMQKGFAEHNALEDDADLSAVDATASIWGGIKSDFANIAQNAIPRLKSGLMLQRCSCKRSDYKLPTGKLKTELPNFIDCSSPKGISYDDIKNKKKKGYADDLGISNYNIDEGEITIVPGWFEKCTLVIDKPLTFTVDPYFYTKEGTYTQGKEKVTKGRCKGKTVISKFKITKDVAKKIKEGEMEHCEDYRRAYALSYGKYKKVYEEVSRKVYCGAGSTCMDEFKSHFKKRTGIDYDSKKRVRLCLAKRIDIRDKKGWHNLITNSGKKSYTKDCSTVIYTPKVNQLKNVGVHSSEDLIKGCGVE